jgi:hypothetical protein
MVAQTRLAARANENAAARNRIQQRVLQLPQVPGDGAGARRARQMICFLAAGASPPSIPAFDKAALPRSGEVMPYET